MSTGTNAPVLELKNIKIHQGLSEETIAFTATLYVDGKKICRCSNRGHGDPINFECPYKDIEHLEAYAKSLPTYEAYGMTMHHSLETLVGDLLEAHQHKQWIKRQTRTKVIFKLEGDKEEEWRTIAHKGQRDKVEQIVREKYGDKITELHK